MTIRCGNCGAELFAGQQFCRQCGARTSLLSHDDVATQILPPGSVPGPPPTATAPIGGERATAPNFGPRPTGAAYQQPQPIAPHTAQGLSAPPPARRRGRTLIWLTLGLLLILAGGAVTAAFFVFQNVRSRSTARRVVINPPVPPIAPHPELPPAVVGEDADALDEEDADVSADKTVITKTFPLAPEDGSFEVKNVNGDITVEGWDEEQAEVKVTKRGGTPDSREAAPIKIEHDGDRLALQTGPGGGQVTYEVKLPRRLQHIGLTTLNGNVKLAGLRGGVEVNTQNGNIKLEDVAGALTTKTMHGNTKVVLAAGSRDAPQVFNSLNGNIEVVLPADINADVKAEATTGAIEVDDALGLSLTKQVVGQRAAGRLGQGGPALVVKTLSGNIKIKK